MAWVTQELPRSFWQSRPATAPESAHEVDAVVVGGGIVGLSTAWWLARLAPDWRVTLLEAGGLAGRASGRNAGFLLTGTPEPFTELAETMGRDAALALWERSRENRELVRAELLDNGLVDADFLPEGSWHAALVDGPDAPEGQEERLEESCQALRDEGLDCEWRPAAAVREASGSRRLGGAIFQARDGGLDPVRLCRGLGRTGGFEVRTGVRVTALEPAGASGSGVSASNRSRGSASGSGGFAASSDGGTAAERTRVVTESGDWLAPRVVVALNAYAGVLLPHLAAELQPVRAQMLATAPGERPLRGVWYINDGHEYLRQTADGAVVLGGRRQVGEGSEVGFLEAPTARIQGALEDFLGSAFPHLAGRPILHRWAGIMAFTPDGLPRLGPAPGLPGTLYAAGLNGHGMSLGFLTGRHLAERTLAEHRGQAGPGELLAGVGLGGGRLNSSSLQTKR